jgi:hypothetical protein
MELELANNSKLIVGVDFFEKSLTIKQLETKDGDLVTPTEIRENIIKIPLIDLKKLLDFVKNIYNLV